MSEEPSHISRADLESKFRALQADIQGRASDKKQSLIAAGSAIATVVVVIAYLFGRRSGRRRSSRVEFRRF
jgi:ABC-type glycerol-3-phosphate transport system permease component